MSFRDPSSNAETRPDGDATELRWAETRRDSLVALCEALVAARSVNPPGNTIAAARVVRDWLADEGLEPTMEAERPDMPNVLARIESGQPGKHLIMNVHLDTMSPGDTSSWTVPVYEMTRSEGRLYGLGMGNMKGAVAAMLHAAAFLHQRRHDWHGRITLAAVSDEVVFGEHGSAYLLRQHSDLRGDALLCGEGPGFGRLAIGEKGLLWLRLTATGRGGHASASEPNMSAAVRLAEAIVQLEKLNGRAISAPAPIAEALADALPAETTLSLNVGHIAAGEFISQIPTAGHAEIDLRLPPGISANEAHDLVHRTIAPIQGVSIHRLKGWDANWTGPESALVRAFQDAHCDQTTADARLAIRLPASDASRWRAHSTPAICFGPQPTLSAGIDDYAEEDEVVRCTALYAATALNYLRADASARSSNEAPH